MLGCQTPLWTKHAAKSLGFVRKSLAMYVDRASDAFRIFEGIVEILRGARDLRAEVISSRRSGGEHNSPPSLRVG